MHKGIRNSGYSTAGIRPIDFHPVQARLVYKSAWFMSLQYEFVEGQEQKTRPIVMISLCNLARLLSGYIGKIALLKVTKCARIMPFDWLEECRHGVFLVHPLYSGVSFVGCLSDLDMAIEGWNSKAATVAFREATLLAKPATTSSAVR